MTRYARKVDANQPAIVAAFRKQGCSVLHLHAVGSDCPDVLVALKGISALVEIKSDGGKLTAGQLKFYGEWPGLMFIVRKLDDVSKVIRCLKDEKEIRDAGMRSRCA